MFASDQKKSQEFLEKRHPYVPGPDFKNIIHYNTSSSQQPYSHSYETENFTPLIKRVFDKLSQYTVARSFDDGDEEDDEKYSKNQDLLIMEIITELDNIVKERGIQYILDFVNQRYNNESLDNYERYYYDKVFKVIHDILELKEPTYNKPTQFYQLLHYNALLNHLKIKTMYGKMLTELYNQWMKTIVIPSNTEKTYYRKLLYDKYIQRGGRRLTKRNKKRTTSKKSSLLLKRRSSSKRHRRPTSRSWRHHRRHSS